MAFVVRTSSDRGNSLHQEVHQRFRRNDMNSSTKVKLQQGYRKSHTNSAFFNTPRRVMTFVRTFIANGLHSRSQRSVSSPPNRPTKPVLVCWELTSMDDAVGHATGALTVFL